MTIEQNTELLPLSEQQQAVYFHSRARARSLHDPAKGLVRTHRFAITDAAVATGTVFPNRARPITFTTQIEITGASAAGLIFELGSSTTGLKLAISGGELLLAAGDVAVGDGGINGSVAVPALNQVGARIKITVAVSPGHGQARIWVDGILVARIQNDPVVALTNGDWSDAGTGSIGLIQNGTSNTRVAVTAAPVDFVLVERLSAYLGQLPKQFHHGFPQILSRPPQHSQLPDSIIASVGIQEEDIGLSVTDEDGDLLSVTITVVNGTIS